MALPLLALALLAGGTVAQRVAKDRAAKDRRRIIERGRAEARADQQEGLRRLRDEADDLNATDRLDAQTAAGDSATQKLMAALDAGRGQRDSLQPTAADAASGRVSTDYQQALTRRSGEQQTRDNRLAGVFGRLRAGGDLRLGENLDLADAGTQAGLRFSDATRRLQVAQDAASQIGENPLLSVGGQLATSAGLAMLTGGAGGAGAGAPAVSGVSETGALYSAAPQSGANGTLFAGYDAGANPWLTSLKKGATRGR